MVLLSPLSHLILLLSLLSPLLLLLPDLCTTQSLLTASTDYLKLPLRHRNPFLSPASDARRLSALLQPKLPLQSGASSGSGQYFVELTLGTPRQTLLLVADTGSDLVWVSCSACRNCSNHTAGSAFFFRQSASFSPYHCYDSACGLVPNPQNVSCKHTRIHSPCQYEYPYADGSESSGFFSSETTTVDTSSGSELKLRGLKFGCAFQISGPSVTGPSFNGAHGVMGLGRGPISLSSQLAHRFGNKFSYCLMDYTVSPPPTSFLLIGGNMTGGGGVSPRAKAKMKYTPLETNPQSSTFYYIGIQSVSVGGVKLPVSPSVWALDELGNGGTIVDSGTTLTFLAHPAYVVILAAFKRLVKLPKPAKESAPGFDLCVNVSGVKRPGFPKMSFELVGDSAFSAPPQNYFISTAEDVKCLALQPVSTPTAFSVIGNLMQQGFLFEFDNDQSRLGFTRHGCALP